MRIDREAFLAAVAALGGCQQDRSQLQPPPVAHVQTAAVAPREVPRVPEPLPLPVVPVPNPIELPPVPHPPAPAPHQRQTPKRWFHDLPRKQRDNVTAFCETRASQQCRASLRAIMPRHLGSDGLPMPEPEPESPPQMVASLPSAKVNAYCKEDFVAPSCETPLVVAFDNQPIDFTRAAAAQFAFVPGEPAATDWPTAATPWIALDLDGDGSITSGAELFGSSTVLRGGGRALNGFAALAPLDANGDGVLDARDPMFAKLVLWSDRNGDHRSSSDELRPLSSVVTSIPLTFTREARCNERDDCEGERGALHWRDAAGADHVGTVVDVYIPKK
ncbi:MAG: hypothetical protein ABJE66_16095 [Deltaproteobacteria bacterium]